MKLCLSFHCLCESYEQVPSNAQELFVSLADMKELIEQLSARGYAFSPLEEPAPNSVTVTFDDGYYNNYLFAELSRSYDIPYVIFVSAYYVLSGDTFPWLLDQANYYSEMAGFDYYKHYGTLEANGGSGTTDPLNRPMTFEELEELRKASPMEIGCHGYYHQPLSKGFEKYLHPEQEQALSTLRENLSVTPKYFALANGLYTKRVVSELLKTFDKVLTIEGRPYQSKDRVIHRLSLTSPGAGGPLLSQIDRHLNGLRQIKRAVRTTRRLWF